MKKIEKVMILCDSFTNTIDLYMIQALQEQLSDRHVYIEVHCINESDDLNKIFKQEKIDVIFVLSNIDIEYKDAMVIYLKYENSHGISYVLDEVKAGEILGEYLSKHNHLMIRYLGNDVTKANQHIEGIKKAYRMQKQPHDFAVKIYDGGGMDALEKMKELFAEQLDLLVLQDERLAVVFQKYILEYHIFVPQNVSVVCFNGNTYARWMSPNMTCIKVDYRKFASDLCIKLFEGTLKNTKVIEPFIFLEGGSVR